MTEPISFSGTLTRRDWLDLSRFHLRCALRLPIRILMAVCSAIIAALMIRYSIKDGFRPVSFAVLAICAYYPLGWLLHHRLAACLRYRRHPDQFIEHIVTFTSEGVSSSSAQADLRINWDRLALLVSTPRGLLLVVPPCTAWIWIPQRLFDGNDHRVAILKLATEHGVPIREMA